MASPGFHSWMIRPPRPTGAVSGLFLLGYGVFRFAVEFTREPDRFVGPLPIVRDESMATSFSNIANRRANHSALPRSVVHDQPSWRVTV
jgi:hypothetical protein